MDKKAIFFKTRLVLSLFLIFLSYSHCVSSTAHAQSIVKPATAASKIRYIPPPLPTKQVVPSGRKKGNASRGGTCVASNDRNEVLTAVIPSYQMKLEGNRSKRVELNTWDLVLATTSIANPTFLFYLPYITAKLPLEFVLQDAEEKDLLISSFTVSNKQPGFVSVTVPSTIPLEIGKYYKWYLIADCGQTSPGVEGWVQRVAIAPKLKQQLQQATPQQRVALYAANGIWYDAVSLAAALRLENPKDLSKLADWTSLLQSVELRAIARQPINNCCAVEQQHAVDQSWDNN